MAVKTNSVSKAPSAPSAPRVFNSKAVPGGGASKIGGAQPVAKPNPGHTDPDTHATSALRSAAAGISSTSFSDVHVAGSGGSVFAPAPDPRDSTYWEQIALTNLNRTNLLNQLSEGEQLDESSYKRNLAAEEYRDPIESRELRENANVAGGIYSTATREDEGNLGQEQYNRRAGLGEEYSQAKLNRIKERSGIEGEYGTGVEGPNQYGQSGINALKESIGRRVSSLQENPTAYESPAAESPTQIINQTIIKRIAKAKKKK